MTRRDNFLKALRHEKHDRMPAYIVIDSFNYPWPLPVEFDLEKINSFTDPEGLVELSKYYGMDTLLRMVPPCVKVEHGVGVNMRMEKMGDCRTATIWETTAGKLRSVSQPSKEANTNYQCEHPIKQAEDYRILLSLMEAQVFSINQENKKESKRFLEVIGNEGIAYEVGPNTPVMDLTRSWAGLENFIYHMVDEEDLVKPVMDVMTENCCRQYELIARNSPCEVIVFWDDANSLYLTPSMFEEYSVPVMKKYADIVHKYGKTFVCHTCGNIRPFLKLFLQTGVDAVDWVAPIPIGDVDPCEAQDIWGNDITMMLSVAPGVMRSGTLDQVEAHIHRLLKGLDVRKNLVFMIPPPADTPLKNLQQVVKVLTRNYNIPLNKSEQYGNILDYIQ